MRRRTWLAQSAGAALAAAAFPVFAASPRAPRILLRSSWQVVNIGDIAHTPGVLALLEQHIPEAEVILWASGDLTDEVASMEKRRFPSLKIVRGSLKADGTASNPELAEAVATSDFLLHGSGPSLVGAKDVRAWAELTHKPFGVYGITHGPFEDASKTERELLNQSRFVFFRDSVSLEHARTAQLSCPVVEFAPDGAFACDLRDEAAAESFLKQHGLEQGRFVCCLSRLRNTPYWLIAEKRRPYDAAKHARNEEMKEHDHAPIRDAICQVVRDTGHRVLLCPEDMTQMAVGRELLYDRLPADVKPHVVWRESFWLTDEALSVYIRSAGIFGSEMHSPIMAVGNGVPAIVCRFAEQTSKGIMWRDIGLGNWLFDFDQEADCEKMPGVVRAMIRDHEESLLQTEKARSFVLQRQRETMAIVRKEVFDSMA